MSGLNVIVFQRRGWQLLLVTLTLSLLSAVSAAADYIGPVNRTTKTTVTHTLRVCYYNNKQYCSCIVDGGECNVTANPCGDWRGGCEEYPQTSTITTSLPNASASASYSCAAQGDNGWCRDGARVDFTASDAAVGYAIQTIEGNLGLYCDPADSATVSCGWTPPQGSNIVSYWAHSSYGDTSVQAVVAGGAPIKVDGDPPTAGVSVGTPDGENSWFTTPITATATGSDAVSGIAALYVQMDGEGWQANGTQFSNQGTHAVQGLAQDNAGNQAISVPVTFQLDSVSPTIHTTIPAPDGAGGWYTSGPVYLGVSGTDATSGMAAAQIQIGTGLWQEHTAVISTDGSYEVHFRTVDQAGNITSHSATIRVDTTGPVALFDVLSGIPGLNGWYTSLPLTGGVSVTDATSGVASVSYRVDGGEWAAGTGITIETEGIHTIDFAYADTAGNTATRRETVSIDATKPSITPIVTGTLGNDDWWTSPVVVDPNPQDAISGIARTEIKVNDGDWQAVDQLTLHADGLYQVNVRVSDLAGNILTDTWSYQIDTTGPACTIFDPPYGKMLTGKVTMTGKCVDGGSGVASIVISVDGGKTWTALDNIKGDWSYVWDTLRFPGPVIVQGIDQAGNTQAGESHSFPLVNALPRVELQEQWYIWNSGSLQIWEGALPVTKVEIRIADRKDRWPAREWSFGEVKDVPSEVRWDRKFGDGTLAPVGDYAVQVTVWDSAGRSARDAGKISIPPVPQPIGQSTATPTTTMVAVLSPLMPVPKSTQTPAPTETAVPSATVQTVKGGKQSGPPVVARISPVVRRSSGLLLAFLTMLGLLLALGFQALRDPRPQAIHQLAITFARLSDLWESGKPRNRADV